MFDVEKPNKRYDLTHWFRRAMKPSGQCCAIRVSSLMVTTTLISGAPAGAADPMVDASPPPQATLLGARETERENWLRHQVRRFRSYPHLDRAYRFVQGGKTREAAEELRRYLELEPRDSTARETYLVLLYQLGDDARTTQEATLLLQERPDTESALLYRALARQRQGQAVAARADFRQAALNPSALRADRLFAANSVAEISIVRGEFAEAEEALNLVARDTDDFQLHFRRGRVFEALGRLADADISYQAAVQRAESDSERMTASVSVGYLAMRRHQWREASEFLRAGHDLDPGNVELLRALAEASIQLHELDAASQWTEAALALESADRDRRVLADLAYSRKDWNRAIGLYRQLLPKAGSEMERNEILVKLAQSYQAQGLNADAEASWRQILRAHETAERLRELAASLEAQGKTAQAASALERSIILQPTAAGHIQLSALYDKLNEPALAIRHTKDAIAIAASPALHRRLGYLYLAGGSLSEATREFTNAAQGDKAGMLHMQLADIYHKEGDESQELRELDLAVRGDIDPLTRQGAQRQRASLYSRRGEDMQAVEALRAAVAAGLDDGPIHMDLGFALLRLKHWNDAIDEFLTSNEREPAPLALFYVAQCYRELQRDSLRLSYLLLAERDVARMTDETRKALYDELGYAQVLQNNDVAAAAAWSKSLALRYDAPIALELAAAQRRAGMLDDAERTLAAMATDSLSVSQRVARDEAIGELEEGKGNLAAAADAWGDADAAQPTAERAYRLGTLAQGGHRNDEAVREFELAQQRDPENALYTRTLAYAYQHNGQILRAEAMFRAAVAQTPDRVALYRDLAYVQSNLGKQTEAAESLREAIDLRRAEVPSPAEQTRADSDLPQMREEYATLARQFGATLYESYRPNGGISVVPQSSGGLIPSQGGAEGSYYPSGLFGRSDDPLQFTARLLWINELHSLAIDHASLQAAVGVRYKPFQACDFFVGAERLLKIGADSQNDWLLRASFGLGRQVAPRYGYSHWNYSQLYIDTGFFTRSSTTAVYAELRQGITLRATTNFLITPHLVLVDRHQNPDPDRSSVFEGGPGVSFKYFFDSHGYKPQWSTIDIVVQYRERIASVGRSGWVLATVVQF
jgi:bacteriophage N4 adsorption protein A